MPSGASASTTAFHGRGKRAHGSRFAGALGAERIGVGEDFVVLAAKGGTCRGAWNRIVLERAREQLPVVIIHDVLEQHLSKALHHAAMDLAFDQHRIHHAPDIVDDGVRGRDLPIKRNVMGGKL